MEVKRGIALNLLDSRSSMKAYRVWWF